MAKKSAPKADPAGTIIDSALALAVTRGWRYVTLQDIADRAAIPLAELQQVLPAKSALIGLMIRTIDERVLAAWEPAGDAETPRERLFDIFMTRFEQLIPFRDGIAALLSDSLCDPLAAARQFCNVRASIKRMLAAAQIPTAGPFGEMRTKGALVIYLSVFRIWLRDDSEDLSKTMAALDKALIKAEKISQRLPA
ncbi:MAG: TetR/AcrR family transcriptional regulator [Rhodospirillales bacterium]|nr:TetR/AcrR family transcriptional regulator [Rhodospirillales bacterium]